MKRYSVFFITIISAFLLFGCGSDNSSEEVEEEIPDTIEQVADDEIKDYGDLSYSELEVLAYEDDPEACYYLGRLYEYGNDDVNQDFEKAIEWYQTAASFDNAQAYTALGYFYLTGTSVEKDFDQASEYFAQALELGDSSAKVGLGRIALESMTEDELAEVTNAPAPAVESDEKEIADTSTTLDDSMEETAKSEDEDSETTEETTEAGDETLDSDEEGSETSTDSAQEKIEVAISYFKEAEKTGNLDATYYLGYLYEKGIGLDGSFDKAKNYYSKVAASESTDQLDQYAINSAYVALGLLYVNNDIIEGEEFDQQVNYDKALEYFQKGADNNFAKALFYCGQIYENGLGVDQDYSEAMDYYLKAADEDFAPALNQIGYLYYNGYGVDVDFSSAVYYQKLAALQGYAPAQVNLGYLYENGYGVERNLNTALSYYELAAEAGIEGANDAAIRVRALINEEAQQ